MEAMDAYLVSEGDDGDESIEYVAEYIDGDEDTDNDQLNQFYLNHNGQQSEPDLLSKVDNNLNKRYDKGNDPAHDARVLPIMQSRQAEECSKLFKFEKGTEKRHLVCQQQCREIGFEPPLPLEEFNNIDWNHVSLYSNADISDGPLMTLQEMEKVKRSYCFPFCHPGPILDRETQTNGWYFPDSILQKVHFVDDNTSYYIVRWVGYEDQFNTLENANVLKDCAVLDLFELKDHATASRVGVGVLRRSVRNFKQIPQMPETNESFDEYRLNEMLLTKEKRNEYRKTIGFICPGTSKEAMRLQLSFLKNEFFPFIESLDTPGFVLSKHYLGCMYGNVMHTAEYDEFRNMCTLHLPSIRIYIHEGFRELEKDSVKDSVKYVSFLVMTKVDKTQKHDDKRMDHHMSVYTVRKRSRTAKDALYFDPAPKFLQRKMPQKLERLKEPKINSIRRRYGVASTKQDCLFQCLKYVIGLHTGRIEFEEIGDEVDTKVMILNVA